MFLFGHIYLYIIYCSFLEQVILSSFFSFGSFKKYKF